MFTGRKLRWFLPSWKRVLFPKFERQYQAKASLVKTANSSLRFTSKNPNKIKIIVKVYKCRETINCSVHIHNFCLDGKFIIARRLSEISIKKKWMGKQPTFSTGSYQGLFKNRAKFGKVWRKSIPSILEYKWGKTLPVGKQKVTLQKCYLWQKKSISMRTKAFGKRVPKIIGRWSEMRRLWS